MAVRSKKLLKWTLVIPNVFNSILFFSIISILTNAEKEIISILKHKPKVVGIILGG
jgi:hypothetical protein